MSWQVERDGGGTPIRMIWQGPGPDLLEPHYFACPKCHSTRVAWNGEPPIGWCCFDCWWHASDERTEA